MSINHQPIGYKVDLEYSTYGKILSDKRSTGSNYNTHTNSLQKKKMLKQFNYFGARYYTDYVCLDEPRPFI